LTPGFTKIYLEGKSGGQKIAKLEIDFVICGLETLALTTSSTIVKYNVLSQIDSNIGIDWADIQTMFVFNSGPNSH